MPLAGWWGRRMGNGQLSIINCQLTAPVRVAIVGVGQRGLQHLSELWRLRESGLVRVVALCDAWKENLIDEKIQRFVTGFDSSAVAKFTSFDRLMKECPCDAVYFCLPPSVHNGEVITAARAGRHVFVEKPMSLYYDEALEMERAITASGVVSCVGFQLRYDPSYEAVCAYLADKRLVLMSVTAHGTLESHSTKHTHTEEVGGPSNRVWTANFEWSGSAMVEAGIHPLDRMRYWAGDIAWVQAAYVPRGADDIENDGNNPYVCSAQFGFENGALGSLMYSKLRRVYRSDGDEIILWDHGQIKFEADGPVSYHYDGPYPPITPPELEQLRHPIPIPAASDPAPEINHTFLTAIATGDRSAIRSPFSDAMNSLAAVLAANASHVLQGERIALKRFATEARYAPFRSKPVTNEAFHETTFGTTLSSA